MLAFRCCSGIVCVCDLKARKLAALGGYWGDEFSQVSLMNYIPSGMV